jgi:hypothetical protein
VPTNFHFAPHLLFFNIRLLKFVVATVPFQYIGCCLFFDCGQTGCRVAKYGFLFHCWKAVITDSMMVRTSEFPVVVLEVPKTAYHSQTKTLMQAVSQKMGAVLYDGPFHVARWKHISIFYKI